MLTIRFSILLILILFSSVFCNLKNKIGEYQYNDTKALLLTIDQTYQNSNDFDIKIQACQDAIRVLNDYLDKMSGGEWARVARTSLASWKTREKSLYQEITYLRDKLFGKAERAAVEYSRSIHPFSRIENMNMRTHEEEKSGGKILLFITYDVRMRGMIIGEDIYRLKVTVPGFISMENKSTIIQKDDILAYE